MAKNWALSIGINKYEFLQPPLKYAVRDAELMRDFLIDEAGFEKVWLMSDNSPDISGKSTRPTRENLLLTLHKIAEKPLMGNEDNFWFFFSGHGRRHAGKDYLMLTNSVGSLVEQTGIAISYITELLRRCGAGNVVLIFDACRDEGDKAGGLGIGSENQKGVIAIYSCSPNEKSWEIDEPISKGAFTHVLLEGLRLQGENNCATVERLDRYLRERVPQLNSEYKKPTQTPCINADSETKRHLILLPRYANFTDIATLKIDAYRAEQIDNNLELAEQLWIRVIAVSSGQDVEAIKALQRIERLRIKRVNIGSQISSIKPKLKSFIYQHLWLQIILIIFAIGGAALLTTKIYIEYKPNNSSTPRLSNQVKPNYILCEKIQGRKDKLICKPIEYSGWNFECEVIEGIPTTIVKNTETGIEKPFIRWVSDSLQYTPENRCREATERLNISLLLGNQYITHQVVNRQNVICTTDASGNSCITILFTLIPNQDPETVLRDILRVSASDFSSPPLRL